MCAPANADWVTWSGLRIEAARISASMSWIAKISASSRMTIIPSWLMSSSRPTNGEMSVAPALAASRPWFDEKISVQFVRMPSSAKRLIASRPFSLIATLTHDVRGELGEPATLLEHPVDIVGDAPRPRPDPE